MWLANRAAGDARRQSRIRFRSTHRWRRSTAGPCATSQPPLRSADDSSRAFLPPGPAHERHRTGRRSSPWWRCATAVAWCSAEHWALRSGASPGVVDGGEVGSVEGVQGYSEASFRSFFVLFDEDGFAEAGDRGAVREGDLRRRWPSGSRGEAFVRGSWTGSAARPVWGSRWTRAGRPGSLRSGRRPREAGRQRSRGPGRAGRACCRRRARPAPGGAWS